MGTQKEGTRKTLRGGGEAETRKGLPEERIARLRLCGGRGRCRTTSMNSYKDAEACKPITLGIKRVFSLAEAQSQELGDS